MPNPEAIQSFDMSREFFERPSSYGGFSLTADKRFINACIEPKDPEGVEPGRHKVAIQTAGGGTGEGLDNALALTVVEKRLVTIEEGMTRDKDDRKLTVFGAHYRCKFLEGAVMVLEEMADPSERTLERVNRWAGYLQRQETVSKLRLGLLQGSAQQQLEHSRGRGHLKHLTEHANGLYPEHTNVMDVRGDGPAFVWVTNLHPNVGQNRNRKPSEPDEAIKVRGYHDSLAASVTDLEKARFSRRVTGLRLGSMFLRAAATQTVITSGNEDSMAFYEVRQADNRQGLEVIEADPSGA